MSALLANADVADQSNTSIAIIVISSGIILCFAGFSLVPVCIAWKRRHRQSDAIIPCAILWGLATAAVSIYAYISQSVWTRERLLRIESGYYDPQDNSGAPALPWGVWLVLAIIFMALIAWSSMGGRGVAGPPSCDKGAS